MAVRLMLEKVEITRTAQPNLPAQDQAMVHLKIQPSTTAAIPMTFAVFPFESLDAAVETARMRLQQFAQDLLTASTSSLLRSELRR